MNSLTPYAKAIASAVVTLAAYLVGVIPAEGSFGDVTIVQWLGAVVFLGAAFGITYQVPDNAVVRMATDGTFTAGPVAAAKTGAPVAEQASLDEVVTGRTHP